jgi:hypothetical protein
VSALADSARHSALRALPPRSLSASRRSKAAKVLPQVGQSADISHVESSHPSLPANQCTGLPSARVPPGTGLTPQPPLHLRIGEGEHRLACTASLKRCHPVTTWMRPSSLPRHVCLSPQQCLLQSTKSGFGALALPLAVFHPRLCSLQFLCLPKMRFQPHSPENE